ncbi:MAG: methyltransferase [Bryobacteraceae bacterium]
MSENAPPPFAQTLQLVLGGWISSAVCTLARLGVPDHMDNTPRSAAEIAPKVGAKPDLLYRLMRATSAVGVLSETDDQRFVQTPTSAALRSDAVPCVRNVALFNGDEWHVRGWGLLDETIRTGERPTEKIYGMPLFEYLVSHPKEGKAFHDGMTDLSTIDSPAVAQAYDFSGIGSLTDVGGGHGLLISTILQHNAGMKGTLYDQPSVIAGAAGGPTESVKARITLTGGDMFASVPQGSDAYMMKYIIHDWPDDLCLKILKACRAGVNPGGKLLVVDMVVPGPNLMHMGKIADLEMMLFPSGKERTETEFRELFAEAGWKLTRVIPTASHVSIIEGVPA